MATATMGIVVVASLAARSDPSGPTARMTSTFDRTRSAKSPGNRSGLPSAFRNSMEKFLLSA